MTADDKLDLVIERELDAPRALVWRAWTDPEQLSKWWAPKPYETPECEMELRAGGKFFTRMTGPDGFDVSGSGCFLEVVEGERIVFTSALLPGFRPAAKPEGCSDLAFTAIFTFEDSGEGRTLYRAVALHGSAEARDTHEKMGFREGWGAVAEQLGKVAASLREG